MSPVEHLMERSASVRAVTTRAGVKYPRSTPSLSESFVSIAEETANSMNWANGAGRNRPNPSEMFLELEAAESRIWSRYLKSFAAGPVSVSAYTSRLSSSASCHASSSSYRFAIIESLFSQLMPSNVAARTTNVEPRTTNDARRTSNLERRTSNVEPRTT